jgi:hypothetical protein
MMTSATPFIWHATSSAFTYFFLLMMNLLVFSNLSCLPIFCSYLPKLSWHFIGPVGAMGIFRSEVASFDWFAFSCSFSGAMAFVMLMAAFELLGASLHSLSSKMSPLRPIGCESLLSS